MLPKVPQVTTAIFQGFSAFLQHSGGDFHVVLNSANLPETAISPDPHNLMPLDTAARILQSSAILTRQPCIGLTWGTQFNIRSTGTFGYLLTGAPTLAEALVLCERYIALVVRPARLNLHIDDNGAVLTWPPPPAGTLAGGQYCLFTAASCVASLREIAGAAWAPAAVELACPPVCEGREARAALGAGVSFGHNINRIVIEAEDLDLRNPRADPALHTLLKELADRQLREKAAASEVARATRKAIGSRLGNGDVSLESVAQDLGMAPRLLQSRLGAEGTTFHKILQFTRRQMAESLLRDTDLPLTEIALRLGFSELSAFTRATSRWFKTPPSALRSQLRAEGAARRG